MSLSPVFLFFHRVRTQAIKFLESLVLLQTYTEADSVVRDGEFNLDQVPLTLKVARPRKLEEEARYDICLIILSLLSVIKTDEKYSK